MSFPSEILDNRALIEAQPGVLRGLQRAHEDAKTDLDDLRRNHLEGLSENGSIQLIQSPPLAVSKVPATVVTGIRLPSSLDRKEIVAELAESMRTWVIASSKMQEQIAYVVESDGMEVHIWFAVAASGGEATPAPRLHAAFPGVMFDSASELSSPRDLVQRYGNWTVITGIPRLEREHDRQFFSLDRVIRGMRGCRFALVVIAEPLSVNQLLGRIGETRKMRSHNHERVRQNITKEIGESRAQTLGISAGGFLPFLGAGLGAYGSYSMTSTHSQSLSGGLERLNAFAEAYDAALLEEEQRLKQAIAEGGWASSCFVFSEKQRDTAMASALWVRDMIGQYEPLEPMRILPIGKAGEDPRRLALPVADRYSRKTPLYTVLNSSELAGLMSLPQEEHPGIDVRRTPRFTINLPKENELDERRIRIGTIRDRDVLLPNKGFYLYRENLQSHTLVSGITGSGKTTTVRTLLSEADVPFLVIEPAKAEYRRLKPSGRPIRVFTAGQETVSPFRLNPFEVPEDGNLGAHMDALAAIINAVFPMEGPMSALVEQAVVRAYHEKGWDTESGVHPLIPVGQRSCEAYPTMTEFYKVVERLVGEQGLQGDYGANIKGALLTRVRSLCTGPKGLLFNTSRPLNLRDLVSEPTVIELRHLGSDENKAFLMGIVLLRLYRYFEYLEEQDQSADLKCVVVVEEAHRLFKKTQDKAGSLVGGNTSYKSVEIFENIMAEARAYGLGLIIVDQLPLRLSEGAVKNTNTKIVHRLSAREDAVEIGGAMGLQPEDAAFLNQLRVGEALLHRADMERPAHVKIDTAPDYSMARRSSEQVAKHADDEGYSMREIRPPDLERVRRALEEAEPGSLLNIGDRLFFTFFVGDIATSDFAWSKAGEEVFDLCKKPRIETNEETIQGLVYHATEAAIRRRYYLRNHPGEMENAMNAWRRCLVPSGIGFRLAPDGILALRRSLESIGKLNAEDLPDWSGFRFKEYWQYTSEAQNHAASILVDVKTGHSPNPETIDAVVELTRHKIRDRLLNEPSGENLIKYSASLGVLLAFQLLLSTTEEAFNELVAKLEHTPDSRKGAQ